MDWMWSILPLLGVACAVVACCVGLVQAHQTNAQLRQQLLALLLELQTLYSTQQQLYAENADLREEVQEHRAQVGTLTIELSEEEARPHG